MSSRLEVVARHVCREVLAVTGGDRRWIMLDTIAQRLHVPWEEAVAAAELAAERGWIIYTAYSVALSEQGRQIGRGRLGRRRFSRPSAQGGVKRNGAE
jgi:Mn-dependent DtxR family transcriptional regulator